jgi:uncharacterized membrane protein
MKRWLTIALAASVALNLFFLGVWAARLWRHRQWHSERGGDAALLAPGAPGNPARPESRRGRRGGRDPLSWMTQEERGALRPQRQALVTKRRDAERVLNSEPFDAAQLRAALEAMRAQTTQIQSSVHERLLERAQSSTPEERKKLAEASWGTPGERGKQPRRRD